MVVSRFIVNEWRIKSNMEKQEVTLLKGNEAIAHAAIRCGADAFFGYPITPQTEIIEALSLLKPWETTGMVVLQAESEVASINRSEEHTSELQSRQYLVC